LEKKLVAGGHVSISHPRVPEAGRVEVSPQTTWRVGFGGKTFSETNGLEIGWIRNREFVKLPERRSIFLILTDTTVVIGVVETERPKGRSN